MRLIDDIDFPEIASQLAIVAQIVDHLPDIPVLRHRDEIALHQAAGGFLGIGEALSIAARSSGSIASRTACWSFLLQILDQRDRVVGIELGSDLGDLLRLHLLDHVVANIIVEFGIDLPRLRDRPARRPYRAFVARRQFDKVCNVRRMERAQTSSRARSVSPSSTASRTAETYSCFSRSSSSWRDSGVATASFGIVLRTVCARKSSVGLCHPRLPRLQSSSVIIPLAHAAELQRVIWDVAFLTHAQVPMGRNETEPHMEKTHGRRNTDLTPIAAAIVVIVAT